MNHTEHLLALASQLPAFEPLCIAPIAASGSNRSYFRITATNGQTFIACSNPDLRENQAFFYLSGFFAQYNLPVPKIIKIHPQQNYYLQEDLGDTSLFQIIKDHGFTQSSIHLLKEALLKLLQMHKSAANNLDFNQCYPRAEMDFQSFMWDLNYFKYYFLKPSGIAFDEQRLENDFQALARKINDFPKTGFLFRDFQSRNIMIHQNKAYFIDYQGGRKGTATYDLASLLYQSSIDMPENLKNELSNFYFSELENELNIPVSQSEYQFRFLLLIRLLQVLGAYGFRGLIENKQYFKNSIPAGLKNLSECISGFPELNQYPELFRAIHDCTHLPEYQLKTTPSLQEKSGIISNMEAESEKLCVRISSFSFRKPIPEDPSGNGGGFVFDCRALPNPGRLADFKQKSGKDREVIDYLEKEEEVKRFLDQVEKMINQSIDSYLKRDFKHLMISFGCTGGQHRSVYCAENIYRKLSENKQINPILKHWEEGIGWGINP